MRRHRRQGGSGVCTSSSASGAAQALKSSGGGTVKEGAPRKFTANVTPTAGISDGEAQEGNKNGRDQATRCVFKRDIGALCNG